MTDAAVTRTHQPSTEIAVPLAARGLTVTYRRRRTQIHAVRAVDLSVRAGQAIGVIGESGAGKSTLAKALLGLIEPSAGAVEVLGQDPRTVSGSEAARLRGRVQVVMQNPYMSLNPRWPVRRIIAEPLAAGRQVGIVDLEREEFQTRVNELLDAVGLSERSARARPRELSGGERQRVAIARALATRPAVLIGDEPITALDNATSRQIVALLRDIQRQNGLSLVLISHSIEFIDALTTYAYVMHRGRVVEHAPTAQLLSRPEHPYSQQLVAASRGAGVSRR